MKQSFMNALQQIWETNNSLVCVGLDSELSKIPEVCRTAPHPLFAFNKAIIDATHDCVCAYKPQIAYYAAYGAEDQLEMTIRYIHDQYPMIPVILDAKRGDIGSTAQMYAQEAFQRYAADAVTVNPFMGSDTLQPFLSYKDKGVIVLCKTSNPGSSDIQNCLVAGKEIYKIIAQKAQLQWNSNNNVMLVIGATYPEEIAMVRQIAPHIPFLVPGVGAQGGDVAQVVKKGKTTNGAGLVINSSRAIIYASKSGDFADAARKKTIALQKQINQYR